MTQDDSQKALELPWERPSEGWTVLSYAEQHSFLKIGPSFDAKFIWHWVNNISRKSFGRAIYLRLWKDGVLGLIGLEFPEISRIVEIGEEELLKTIHHCRVLVVDSPRENLISFTEEVYAGWKPSWQSSKRRDDGV